MYFRLAIASDSTSNNLGEIFKILFYLFLYVLYAHIYTQIVL